MLTLGSSMEDSKPVQILSKAIWALSLCPIDAGVVALPALRALDGARMLDEQHEPAPTWDAVAACRGDADSRAPEKLAASIKLLCGAGRDLQCRPTRILQAVR